jgi:hypothetical protein
VHNVVASGNGSVSSVYSGAFDVSGGLMRIAHSVATGNNYAYYLSGNGAIESYGDNNFRGNLSGVGGSDTTGTFTVVPNK